MFICLFRLSKYKPRYSLSVSVIFTREKFVIGNEIQRLIYCSRRNTNGERSYGFVDFHGDDNDFQKNVKQLHTNNKAWSEHESWRLKYIFLLSNCTS